MNKRFFLGIAAIALMAVSCTQNDVEVVTTTDADAISLNASTAVSRASITKVGNLESGFSVWSTKTGSGDWFINGQTHALLSGKWNFDPAKAWPTLDTEYPVSFYAHHPMTAPGVFSVISTPVGDVKLNITVPESANEQKDIVAAKETANAKPSTGNLTMTFKHILSKLHFTVTNSYSGTPNANQHVFVQAVGFKHVNTKTVYDIPAGTYTAPTDLGDYTYFGKFFDSSTGASVLPEKEFHNVTVATDNAAKFYAVGVTSPAVAWEDMFLMLVPQVPTVWDPTSSTPVVGPLSTEAYVQLVYRWENYDGNSPANLVDQIGFKNANTHPDYAGSALETAGYTGPLYVKVGYTYTATWEKGKGYQYNIPVPGTSGGRLITDKLIDNEGNETDLKVPGVDETDPILGDEYIHLIPTVTEWDDTTPVIPVQ